MTARIWIGGPLLRSESYKLVLVVKRSKVNVGDPKFEHIICQPRSIEGLLEGLRPDGRLHLQHPTGQLDAIIKVCRKLGLTHRVWRSTSPSGMPLVEVWAPGLPWPVRMFGHVTDPNIELVEACEVRRAIKLLQRNKACLAKHTLLESCPEIPDVPPLELIDD